MASHVYRLPTAMNKIITSLIFCLFSATIANSQPVTLSDTALVPISKDSANFLNDMSILSAIGQPLTDATWDLSQAQYYYRNNQYFEREAPNASGAFPTASFRYKNYVPYNQD